MKILTNKGIYDLSISEGTGTATLSKSISMAYTTYTMKLSSDKQNVYMARSTKTLQSSSAYGLSFETYSLNNLLNDTTYTAISAKTLESSSSATYWGGFILAKEDDSVIFIDRHIASNMVNSDLSIYKITATAEATSLVALKYNGKYFYRLNPEVLTAGQPDVRAGKTFIGWMGYVETGTMEVTE